MSFFSHNTSATPSFPENGVSIAHMKLTDLLVNPHVKDLLNKWTDANSKATCYVEEQHHLLQQVSSLQNDVFMLRTELAAAQRKLEGTAHIPPNSNLHPHMPLQRPKPSSNHITRPEGLPHSILWLPDDARQYDGLTSESNKSRPKMELCIRREDGSVIPSAEYSALQGVVRRFISFNLTPLSVPKDPKAASTQRTRRWYRKWYPQNYQELLTRLEEAEPLLALCSGSWKADQLVGRHLYWLAEQAKKGDKQAGQKCPFSEDLDFDVEWDEQAETDVRGSKSAKAGGSSVSKKKKMAMGKGKENTAPRPISAPAVSPSIPIEMQLTTLGPLSTKPLPLTPNNENAAPKICPPTDSEDPQPMQLNPFKPRTRTDIGQVPPLDVTFIQIDKTLSSLRREFSVDFSTMSTAVNFFDAMEADPHFRSGVPSADVLHFIESVEDADPNSSDISEDETNSQWGHKQLSGTWKGVLTGWDAVGSCDIVVRLLAALLKTCRVARYICSERRVRAMSFLSDMYLDQIIDHLWELWKTAGGPISKGKGKEMPTTNTTSSTATTIPSAHPTITESATAVSDISNDVNRQNEVEKALKKLTKEQLKSVLEAHGIKTSSQKTQPTKPELIADILQAPISLTNAVFTEVQSRLDKRLPRGRKKELPKA